MSSRAYAVFDLVQSGIQIAYQLETLDPSQAPSTRPVGGRCVLPASQNNGCDNAATASHGTCDFSIARGRADAIIGRMDYTLSRERMTPAPMHTVGQPSHVLRAWLTPEDLGERLDATASSWEQKAALRWVNTLLEPFSHDDRLQFWLKPRRSLRGTTPLQALESGQLRQLEQAAEAFSDA